MGVSGGIRSVPNVLFAAEADHANGAAEASGFATAFKRDANGMRMISIFVDEQQRPLAVRAPNGIARDEGIPGGIFDSAIDGIEVMSAAAMRHPLVIDDAAGVVKRRVADDLCVSVPKNIAPDGPSLAAVFDDARFDGRMNVKRAALGEEAADIVGEPQSGEDVGHVD